MEVGRGWVQVQLREVVNNVNGNLAKLQHLGLRKLGSPGSVVVVAAHRRNGGKLGELFDYSHVTNVARMNDEVATTKRLNCLGAEQPVGVGDQPHAKSLA